MSSLYNKIHIVNKQLSFANKLLFFKNVNKQLTFFFKSKLDMDHVPEIMQGALYIQLMSRSLFQQGLRMT